MDINTDSEWDEFGKDCKERYPHWYDKNGFIRDKFEIKPGNKLKFQWDNLRKKSELMVSIEGSPYESVDTIVKCADRINAEKKLNECAGTKDTA